MQKDSNPTPENEQQAINDLIEGFIAGYPLCCILDFANISYHYGLFQHGVENLTRTVGYEGPVSFNRDHDIETPESKQAGISSSIDLPTVFGNNYIRCKVCTAEAEKDHKVDHRICPNCLGCESDSPDSDYQKLLRWCLI